jgi:hypothetical protein
MVVATVGDIGAARDRLEQLVPYPICVAPVRYSTRQLAATAEALRVANTGWTVDVDPQVNRVRVRLAVIDGQTLSAIAQRPEALADPLVVKVSP